MIEAVISFWVVLFSLRALLSKNGREAVESLFITLLMITFYLFYILNSDDLAFFIPIVMVFGMTLATFFLADPKRGSRD